MATNRKVLSVTKHKRLLGRQTPHSSHTNDQLVVTANDRGEKIVTLFHRTLDQTISFYLNDSNINQYYNILGGVRNCTFCTG